MKDFEQLFNVGGLSLERMRSFLAVAEAGNISKAANGDPIRQSQFSRQIKELEGVFEVKLTRLIGRRIQITEDGQRLAQLIRRHFEELDGFREIVAGRPVAIRIGAAASILEWMLIPRLAACREALGEVLMEMEHLRSADVVRGVMDGRLDFGIVRENAAPKGVKSWEVGKIGYALFVPKSLRSQGEDPAKIVSSVPIAELLPSGQFHERYANWVSSLKSRPKVLARVGSFLQLAQLVRSSAVAAVLPESAIAGFNPASVKVIPIDQLAERPMALLANSRGLDRAGIPLRAAGSLAKVIEWSEPRVG